MPRPVSPSSATATLTSSDATKNYGTDDATALAGSYTVSGLNAGVSGAYLADTNATAFSGTPDVTSAGSAATAHVNGGPYAITVAQGTTQGIDGYALAYSSMGKLTVNPLIVALSGERTYDATTAVASTALSITNVKNSDSVSLASGSAVIASKNAGTESITGAGTLTLANNSFGDYTLAGLTGSVTVDKEALTLSAATNSKTYDTTTSAAAAPSITSGALQGSDSFTGLHETYDTASVGTGKTLTVGYASLNDGNSGNNYTVSTAANNTGIITAANQGGGGNNGGGGNSGNSGNTGGGITDLTNVPVAILPNTAVYTYAPASLTEAVCRQMSGPGISACSNIH